MKQLNFILYNSFLFIRRTFNITLKQLTIDQDIYIEHNPTNYQLQIISFYCNFSILNAKLIKFIVIYSLIYFFIAFNYKL